MATIICRESSRKRFGCMPVHSNSSVIRVGKRPFSSFTGSTMSSEATRSRKRVRMGPATRPASRPETSCTKCAACGEPWPRAYSADAGTRLMRVRRGRLEKSSLRDGPPSAGANEMMQVCMSGLSMPENAAPRMACWISETTDSSSAMVRVISSVSTRGAGREKLAALLYPFDIELEPVITLP